MAFRLIRFGINSHYLNDLPLMQAYRSIVKPKDLVVLFSISGSDRYTEYFHSYKESGCTCVLITMNPKSVLFKDADLAICLPCASKSSTTLFLDDQLIFYLFIEILIAEIARQKKEFLWKYPSIPRKLSAHVFIRSSRLVQEEPLNFTLVNINR